MSPLSHKLRELAEQLRKHAADLAVPKPLANPVASRSKGDLGSLGNLSPKISGGVKAPGGPNAK